MKRVELVEVEDFFGVVVACASGVSWAAQIGGTACLRRELEGIFCPLVGGPRGADPDDPMLDVVADYDPELVRRFLDAFDLRGFEPLPPEARPAWARRVCEAWVPIVVRGSDFDGAVGVLVYPNSD
jgi:hypothetical protein